MWTTPKKPGRQMEVFGEEPLRGRLPVRAALSTLFLLSNLPFGLLLSVVPVVLLLAGLAPTIVWIGLPILALALRHAS